MWSTKSLQFTIDKAFVDEFVELVQATALTMIKFSINIHAVDEVPTGPKELFKSSTAQKWWRRMQLMLIFYHNELNKMPDSL